MLKRLPTILPINSRTYARHQGERTQPTEDEARSVINEIFDTFKAEFLVLDGLDEAVKEVQLGLF